MSKVKEIAERLERENAKTAATVTRVLGEQRDNFAAAEAILLQKAASGAGPGAVTAEEALLFDSLGWDGLRIRHEHLRCQSVLRLQREAGTAGDRKAAAERLAAARAVADTEGAKLRAELERMTAEIGGQLELIDNEVSEAVRVYEQYQRTILQLRGATPAHIRQFAEFKGNETRQRYLAEIQKFEQRSNETNKFSGRDKSNFNVDHYISDRQIAAAAAQNFAPQCLDAEGFLILERWHAYVSDRVAKLPQQERRLAELQREMATAVKAAEEKILDCYLDE